MPYSLPYNKRVRLRQDTANNWTKANPVLFLGEFGFETDTKKIKIGDGTTLWSSLGYFPSTGGGTSSGSESLATVSTLAPENPTIGQIWYNPTADETSIYANNAWVLITPTPVELTDITTTINAKGDLLVGTADNAVARLGVGNNNQVLIANSSTATGLTWGKVTATNVDFYYASQGQFPSAIDNHGAIVHSHSDGQMYYAHGGVWNALQSRVTNVTDTEISYLDGVTSAIQNQINTKAPTESPTFTGTVVIPTQTIASSDLDWEHYDTEASLPEASTRHGMFAHVHGTGAAYYAHGGSWYMLAKKTDLDLKAPLASPTFTGTPIAPTAAVGTSTTQVATTAFVMNSVDDDQFILAGQIF